MLVGYILNGGREGELQRKTKLLSIVVFFVVMTLLLLFLLLLLCGRIMAPKDDLILILRNLHGKRDCTDVITLRILRLGDYLGGSI